MPVESKAMEARPLLLGHRGARAQKSIQENTLAAFDFSLISGCDGFEFDVRLSADGQAVICHDPKTKKRGQEITQHAARELGLPLLREVLNRYQGKAFLDIELKVAGLEKITADLLRDRESNSSGFVVSSFLPKVLETLHGIAPGIPLGLICETQSQFRLWRELPVEYVIAHYKLVRLKQISEIKAAGKKILVWTVNLPAAMKRFAKWGVDGIVSDKPQQLGRVLGAPSGPGK